MYLKRSVARALLMLHGWQGPFLQCPAPMCWFGGDQNAYVHVVRILMAIVRFTRQCMQTQLCKRHPATVQKRVYCKSLQCSGSIPADDVTVNISRLAPHAAAYVHCRQSASACQCETVSTMQLAAASCYLNLVSLSREDCL